MNYSTGNINFIGTVIVEGRIEDNFTITATGDIIIKGNVGKSTLEAAGNIVIDGGIIGKNEAIIKAGKNVYAKFIESANVTAKQSITCRKMIMHSNIIAGVSVKVIGGGERGALIGGNTKAGESVQVNDKLYANTHIFFGNVQRNFSNEEVHVRLGLIDGKIMILTYD